MRARLLAQRRFAELAAPIVGPSQSQLTQTGGPSASTTVVAGALTVPAILFRFKDSPQPTPGFLPADYDAVLFAQTPPAGRPYTYRSFYQQMSNGLFDIHGATYGYANLDSNEVYYTGGVSASCAQQNPYGSSNCNGLFSGLAISRMQEALTKSLQKLDATVNFAQYVDSASGFVPLVLFLHDAIGGECGPTGAPQNHLWAHRFALATPYQTQDDWPGHSPQKVQISDYVLQPAVGGSSACNSSEIMPIGTVAHETGHSFGLPDLYDTQGSSEGVGQWSLMGSGNFTSPFSPSRMDAWSLNQLGWITVTPLATNGTYTFDAVPLSHTAYYVSVQNPNPRSEYFLLENRQRQQSDSAMIRYHCQRSGNPPSCGGGLLIWHIDGTKLSQGGNALNSGPIHAVELIQADGFGNLDANSSSNACSGLPSKGCSNRGDAGDPFPGTSGNTAFIYRTNPASLKNLDQSFSGVAIDSITQLATDRTMSFRLRFGALTVARGSDTTATVQFDGAGYNVFRDLLDEGSAHTVGFADGQLAGNGRTRFHFVSWSDGGAQNHPIVGSLAGGTLTASLGRDFQLVASATTGGSIAADTAVNLAGDFIPEGSTVTLTPTPDAGLNFCGWTGSDTTSTDSVLTLHMARPFTVTGNFGTQPAITSGAARRDGVMGAAYADTLRISGGSSLASWSVTGGALPAGVTLSSSGVLTGYPQTTGTFNFTATVMSCAAASKAFSFSVTAPTLTTADVVSQLLGPTAPLSPDQVRYLDFLGNKNNAFDIGDFLAWVKATGAPLSPAVLQASQRKGGRQ